MRPAICLRSKPLFSLIEAWSAAAFSRNRKNGTALRSAHPLDYQNLVHLIHPEPQLHNIMRGADEDTLRKRDGFKLTDDRGTMRDALYEIDYCMICHEREKDACSTGLHEKDGHRQTQSAWHQDRRLSARRKHLRNASAQKAGRRDRFAGTGHDRQSDVCRHRPPHLQRLHEGLHFPEAGAGQYSAC